ncbi:F0F1 ATP synthase subunit delta [Microbacterium sp. ZXX196]|uniref:F0F1 ATP synthase subunit delta n=1 Tax=Microbacterium sp. ZXX196 TaxID=2609291 RepID=UPI001322BDD9|nr:F0F1 ATP synthase subunit delta [Microbacterium sp. ZXX196]
MGSATTQALVASASALATTPVDLDTARELFAAARAAGQSPALGGALADHAAEPGARTALVGRVFGSLSESARSLLAAVAAERWSSAADLVAGIEELAIRAAAQADTADVEGELFQVTRVIAENPELELALGARLGDAGKKGDLVERILQGSVGAGALLIARSVVEQPGERRVRQALERAIAIVAAQRGRSVATVHTATPLTDAQRDRLASSLSRTYGTPVTINAVVDPEVVGGIRVQIADDVIDGSISSRLADLRSRLAG